MGIYSDSTVLIFLALTVQSAVNLYCFTVVIICLQLARNAQLKIYLFVAVISSDLSDLLITCKETFFGVAFENSLQRKGSKNTKETNYYWIHLKPAEDSGIL